MSEFEEYNLEDADAPTPEKKRPVFITVLAILSFVYIGLYFIVLVFSLASGPLNEDELEESSAAAYSIVEQLEDQGFDLSTQMVEPSIRYSEYMNNEVFYLYNLLQLLTLIVGAIGVFMMFKLKKTGFHIYVGYSLLPILIMYAITPMELIMTITVVTSVVISALFCVLYGLNLKDMK
jgi:hypothetical protein